MKTVLITGANRGIGLATSKLLRKKNIILLELQDLKLETFQVNFTNAIYQMQMR